MRLNTKYHLRYVYDGTTFSELNVGLVILSFFKFEFQWVLDLAF